MRIFSQISSSAVAKINVWSLGPRTTPPRSNYHSTPSRKETAFEYFRPRTRTSQKSTRSYGRAGQRAALVHIHRVSPIHHPFVFSFRDIAQTYRRSGCINRGPNPCQKILPLTTVHTTRSSPCPIRHRRNHRSKPQQFLSPKLIREITSRRIHAQPRRRKRAQNTPNLCARQVQLGRREGRDRRRELPCPISAHANESPHMERISLLSLRKFGTDVLVVVVVV